MVLRFAAFGTESILLVGAPPKLWSCFSMLLASDVVSTVTGKHSPSAYQNMHLACVATVTPT